MDQILDDQSNILLEMTDLHAPKTNSLLVCSHLLRIVFAEIKEPLKKTEEHSEVSDDAANDSIVIQ